MNRVRTLITVLGATAAVASFAPAAASATTYCVNDAACVSAGGTNAASFAAATTAVNALGDADTIRVGAGALTLPGAQNFPNGSPVTIIGAGAGVTTITGPVTGVPIAIRDAASSIQGVSLVSGGPTSSVLAVERGVVRDVTVTSTANNSALTLADGAVMERTTVTSASFAVSASAAVGTTTIVRDSVVSAAASQSISTSGAGTVIVTRSNITGQFAANFSATTPGTTELTDSIVRGRSGATLLLSTGDAGGAATGTVRVRNVTLVGLGAGTGTAYAIVASTFGGTGNVATTNVDVQGVALSGYYDVTVWAAAPDNNASNITISNSDIDLSAGHIISGGLGVITVGAGVFSREPGFVDAAGGDFRPRAGSPLLDAGPTTLLASQNGSTISGTARAVNGRADIGALEYARNAPAGVVTAPASLASGASGTASVAATDADPGEAAQATYVWSLPDGSHPTGASVPFVAPDAPGTYSVAVTITDPVGASTTAFATFAVPVERVRPKLILAPTAIKRATLLKRGPVKVATTTNERAKVSETLTATVSLPPLRRGGKRRVSTVKIGTAILATGSGTRTASIVPTPAAVKTLAALLKTEGATVTWVVTGSATDPSLNVGVASAKLKVT